MLISSTARAPEVYHREHLCIDYSRDENETDISLWASSAKLHSVSTQMGYSEGLQSQAVTLARQLAEYNFPCINNRHYHLRQRGEVWKSSRRAVQPQIGSSVQLDYFRSDSNGVPVALSPGVPFLTHPEKESTTK